MSAKQLQNAERDLAILDKKFNAADTDVKASLLAGENTLKELGSMKSSVNICRTPLIMAALALGIAHALRHTVFAEYEVTMWVQIVGSVVTLLFALAFCKFMPNPSRAQTALSLVAITGLAVASAYGDIGLVKKNLGEN